MRAPHPHEDGLRVERLPDLPSGEKVWGALARAAGNPFSTWEWAAAWWRHFGDGREQRILGCRDGEGALVGVLPLYMASRRPLRVLRFIGHDPADQLGPVCAPRDRRAVAAAFERALGSHRDWDVCVAERLADGEGWPDLLGGRVTRRESSPTIRLETSDWEEHLASKSANYRSQARRWERRLAAEYTLNYRIADDPGRIDEDMTTFLRLHDARWAATGSTAFAGRLSQFHRDLAALALASGWLRLGFLELDGQPRAAIQCFRLGGADWYYQAGRDPDFDRDRVGNVLLNNAVREAVQGGMDEFKLLLGAHGYKNRLMTDDAPVTTIVLTRNAALGSTLSAALAVRRAGRSTAERLRGPFRGGG